MEPREIKELLLIYSSQRRISFLGAAPLIEALAFYQADGIHQTNEQARDSGDITKAHSTFKATSLNHYPRSKAIYDRMLSLANESRNEFLPLCIGLESLRPSFFTYRRTAVGLFDFIVTGVEEKTRLDKLAISPPTTVAVVRAILGDLNKTKRHIRLIGSRSNYERIRRILLWKEGGNAAAIPAKGSPPIDTEITTENWSDVAFKTTISALTQLTSSNGTELYQRDSLRSDQLEELWLYLVGSDLVSQVVGGKRGDELELASFIDSFARKVDGGKIQMRDPFIPVLENELRNAKILSRLFGENESPNLEARWERLLEVSPL